MGFFTFSSSPSDARPSLAVVAFIDQTMEPKLSQIDIGKIITDAIVQKFYEFSHVRLVSPLHIARIKREMGITEESFAQDPSKIEELAREVGGRLLISGTLSKLGETFILSANLNDLEGEESELLSTSNLRKDSEDAILGSIVDDLCLEFQQSIGGAFKIKDIKPH